MSEYTQLLYTKFLVKRDTVNNLIRSFHYEEISSLHLLITPYSVDFTKIELEKKVVFEVHVFSFAFFIMIWNDQEIKRHLMTLYTAVWYPHSLLGILSTIILSYQKLMAVSDVACRFVIHFALMSRLL